MSEPSKHSKLPPSSAYRWSRCTASIKFIEDNEDALPKDSSVYADEGTRAHAYLTASLKHTLGQTPDNEEMRTLIEKLMDYIHSLMGPDDRLLVDQRVPLFYLPGDTGTLDIAILGPRRVIILDLKWGAGVGVYAEKNEQTAIYAESQLRKLEEIETFPGHLPVHLIIYQPRDRNDPQVVREWILTRDELHEFCKPIERTAQDILAGRNLKFEPGVACKFCRAGGLCTAKGTAGLEVISDEPVDVVLSQPKIVVRNANLLTREQRQRVLVHKKEMIAFLEAVEDQEMAELLNGAPPLLFKLVEGKSNRAWTDEAKVKKLLGDVILPDEICPPKPELISPKQAEDLLKTVTIPGDTEKFMADFHALIQKPAGKPTLVPIEDKRPALLMNSTEGLNKISEYDPLDLI